MQSFLRATHVAILTVSFGSLFSMTACSKVDFGRSDKNSGKRSQELTGGQNSGDCYKLGGGYDNSGKDGTDVVVVPPGKDDSGDGKDYTDGKDSSDGKDYSDGGKGEEPNPPGKDGDDDYNPCENPGQHPGQTDGKDGDYPGQNDGYDGKDASDGGYPGQNPTCDEHGKCEQPSYEPGEQCEEKGPGQYPTQKPIDNGCGKDGKYCDDGGPGQYPKNNCKGGGYDRHELDSCIQAFRSQGYDTRGQWNVDVKEVKNVSVLSDSQIVDYGNEHSIVIIKSVSVLGSQHFKLMNPNALYCIKSVSVLEKTKVTSCHQNNVVWGKDINVLSGVHAQTVNCQY